MKTLKEILVDSVKFWEIKGWLWIAIGFVITGWLSLSSVQISMEAAAQPNLVFDFKTIKWQEKASVLVANENMIRLPERFPIQKYTHNGKSINKITIRNNSDVLAKNVTVEIKISEKTNFIIAAITVGSRKYPSESWHPGIYYNTECTFVRIVINRIFGNDSCEVYFVPAYPEDAIVSGKESVPDAVTIQIENDQQKELLPPRSFPLSH